MSSPRPRLWRASLRCERCRKLSPLEGLRAWLFQPVGPTQGRGDGGRTHFRCSTCRQQLRDQRGSS